MRRLASALCLLSACSSGSTFIALPELEPGVQSWVLVRIYDDGVVEVHAADRDAPVSLVERTDLPQRVELRGLRAGLAELELSPGLVVPDPSAPYTRALPRGDVVWAAEREGDALAAWGASRPDLRTEAFRYRATTPCAPLGAELADLPLSGSISWAVSVDADTIYFGTSNAAASLRAGSAPESVPWVRLADEPVPVARSAWVDAGGRVWLGDDDGGLWMATATVDGLRATRVVGPVIGQPVTALAGDPGAPERELYGVTRGGLLQRLEGDRWVLVRDLEVVDGRQDVHVVWLGPGELLAGARLRRTLLHHRDGRPPRELGDFPRGVTALARLSPADIAVGVGAGQVAHFVSGELEPAELSSIALDILTFTPYDDGFLYAGASGFVGQWLPEVGFCPVPTAALAPRTVSRLLPVGDEVVALGDRRVDGTTPYTRVRVPR